MINENNELEIDPQDRIFLDKFVAELEGAISNSPNALNEINTLDTREVSIEYNNDGKCIKIKKLKFQSAAFCVYYDEFGNPHRYRC
jgi:hypothetical protein